MAGLPADDPVLHAFGQWLQQPLPLPFAGSPSFDSGALDRLNRVKVNQINTSQINQLFFHSKKYSLKNLISIK
jgi:hypothetical protein